MLNKLIKYEFKATSRIFLPLYLGVLIVATLNKIAIEVKGGFQEAFTDSFIMTLATVLIYFAIIISLLVITFAIIVERFRKNILCDEGYLMNTIPVKPWENISSKLIIAVMWNLFSVIIGAISVLILDYRMIADIFNTIMDQFGNSYFIMVGVSSLIGAITTTLMIYLSLAVGNIFSQNKILAAIGTFIVLNTISNILSFALMVANINIFDTTQMETVNLSLNMQLPALILSAVMAIAYFILTNYILSKKLDLQ